MSLPGSPVSSGPRWAPTHVQVTVLKARGLRAKAKGAGGGSDAYAVMALGKEKFATSVAERCQGSPEWREEATFELPPPPRRGLGGGPGPGGAPPALLQLTVFHRALLGLDKFLGRAEVSLAELQTEGGRRSTRWYKLHSKPGKKEKERGEIEVDIQFMRSNMTASMFDLSMKDKSRTPLGKLKDKLKGKRGNGLPDTASAIIPSISHSPADDSEEDEKEKKKSKFKTLFSKPGLQKSNISQSMSVLPTLQPVSERVRLKPKPSTNKDEDNVVNPHSDMSHKRMGSGDSKQLNQIITNNSKKDVHSLFGGLKSKNDTVPRSNVCINGSHVYMEECESKSDTIPRDSTPSSPQTSQQKHHFLSQENLCSESNKELEISGRLPPDKGPPVSSSLESFKAMTLPSYKLLNSGDFLESNTPVISDTPKEAKENKKQENKKSGLLSLVTGKKEAKGNEEAENSIDTSPKVKEVKRNEKELPRKEINPFEIPSSDKSSATGVPIAKASLNPFNEKSEEEEKPEKKVGSDDELLSNSHQDAEEMAACGDLSHSMDDFTEMPRTEKRELTSDEKATGERQTISLVNISDPDDAVKPHDLLVESSAVDLQNADHTLKQKNGESFKEDKRGGCPEFPDKPSHSPNSLQSDALGCNRAETPKKATTEALDAKGEISGKKKLLQARVSPSETHSTQTLQSGGTLQPVKPMNATTSKPAKPLSITTKMLDNQNEINLKKYDPSDPAYAYAQLTHDELIQLVLKQKDEMAKRDLQVRELEDYIDNLLVRVMEETPNILRVQEHLNKKAGKM
ncbi:Rab11 family-interacting protein 1 [Varanus komodoensis]|nr:Rab11 family-interacting protein 1 [Varanus komodoensis]